MIINLILAIVITETLTELLSKSSFFSPLREWFFNKRQNKVFKFIHDLLDCAYCTSVWIGLVVSLVLVKFYIVSIFIDWFILWMVVHRLSNVFHFFIDRVKGQIY